MFKSMFSGPQVIYFIPPWKEADTPEKWRLVLYYAAIYLPVLFLLSIILILYSFYIGFFVADLVSENRHPPDLYYWQSTLEHEAAVRRGWVYFTLMTVFVCLFCISFVRATRTSPGVIPDNGEWDPTDTTTKSTSVERRKDGSYRACARCVKLKPDRSHHCRLCDVCVLKMDHHCPWIANCVGHFNYKYFFLIVTYAVLSLWLFSTTFWEALLVNTYDPDSSLGFCLCLLMTYSLACLLTFAVTCFWIFHINLVLNNSTTIEYCEKRRTEHATQLSPYNLSAWQNIKSALGHNPWLWLVPVRSMANDKDDGINFRTRFDFE
jgi:hypothetical protein